MTTLEIFIHEVIKAFHEHAVQQDLVYDAKLAEAIVRYQMSTITRVLAKYTDAQMIHFVRIMAKEACEEIELLKRYKEAKTEQPQGTQ